MTNKKKNEEIQSRREFFKKAAKGALPMIGAIVLASSPAVLQATEVTATGCNGSCSGLCSGCRSCTGTCSGLCEGCRGCSGTCSGLCEGCRGCSGTCSGRSY